MSPEELETLRQACAWAKVFLGESQKALIGEPSNHRSSAVHLMHLLAELTVTKEYQFMRFFGGR